MAKNQGREDSCLLQEITEYLDISDNSEAEDDGEEASDRETLDMTNDTLGRAMTKILGP